MGQLDFPPRVESDMERIEENEDLTDRDKELLARLKRDVKLDDKSYAHIHKVLTHLKLMGEGSPTASRAPPRSM